MFLTTTPSALRAAGGRTCISMSRTAALQQKWFSTSPTHRAGHIISFTKSSSPELSELLNHFREKVILPTYLSIEQRKKIYNPKLKQFLQNDPITMEIDGVVHKFRHVSMVSGLPNTTGSITKALALMKTPGDFENLRPLLEGCVRARRKLTPVVHNKVIRRAAMHNCMQTAMNIVKDAEKTGLKLNRSETINELLVWIQKPAIESGFDEAKTKAALHRVRVILDMLEGDEVHKPTPKTAGAFPFYRDPQVLGARLHMAAARAVHHQGGKDVDGSVAKYAEEIVKLWPENAGLLDLQPDASYQDRDKMRYLLHRNSYLWCASPVLNGLMLAAQVVDPALAMQLQNRADMVEAEVKTALASPVLNKGGRGETLYNSLFNPQEKAEETEEAEEGEEVA